MAVDDYQNAAYKKTDSRGRITLGKEHAGQTVAVAYTIMPDPSGIATTEPSQTEKNKLTELARWARENGHTPLDYDVEEGRVYNADAEWVDAEGVEGLQE